jgi:glycosyltransferase involved in cell wall biosynthesis
VNIICVTHAYPRTEGDVAGSFIHRLMLALHARGHAIDVIAPADRGNASDRKPLQGIPVTRVRYAAPARETLAYTGTMVETSRSPAGAVAAANLVRAQTSRLRRMARTGAPDVIHAQWWVPAGVSAWMSRLSRTVPYVVTVHGTDVRMLERSRIARALARRVLRGAAAVTAVSSYLAAKVARAAGIDPGTIVVQPMPAAVEGFTRHSTGGDGIAVIGRLTKQKNLRLVLQALARLRADGADARLRIVGDGPERQALEAQAHDLGLADRVDFVGSVEPGDVAGAVGNADVSVFAATQEGYGLTAAESFMLGIPVVALQTGGGVTDVVPPSGAGRLVPGDPAAMAKAIKELLDDPDARGLATTEGARLRESLDPQHVAEVFERVYAGARHALPLDRDTK